MMASISPTACAPAEEMAFRPGSSLLDLDDLGTPNPIGHYYSAVMTSLNGYFNL